MVAPTSSLSAGRHFYEWATPVFFDDLDAVGIVHNVRYLLFAERAMGAFWKQLGLSATPQLEVGTHADRFHLVKANTIEYLRPITGTGEIRVRLWVEKLGTTSLTFAFAVMPKHEEFDYAVGTRTVVSADPETRRPRPWSAAMRAVLQTVEAVLYRDSPGSETGTAF